jgi:hypothetical protein
MPRSLLAFLILIVSCGVTVSQEHSRPVVNPTPRPTPISRPTPVPTPAPDPEGWVTFNSAAGHFSILMPEIPEDKVSTEQSEHGPYTTHLFLGRGGQSIFLIGWVDYDPNFNFNLSLELEANRDNFVKGVQGTLLNSQNKRIDGYMALEFTAQTADRIFRARVYMVGRRPYLFVAGYPKGVDDQTNVSRFLGSIKLSSN